jgi:hypothetical protein
MEVVELMPLVAGLEEVEKDMEPRAAPAYA